MRAWTVLYSPGPGMGEDFVVLALILWSFECLACDCRDLLRYDLLSWLFRRPAGYVGVVGVLRHRLRNNPQFLQLENGGLGIGPALECFPKADLQRAEDDELRIGQDMDAV
jgi:hypothetical protein